MPTYSNIWLMSESGKSKVEMLARKLGVLRASDLDSEGLARKYLSSLVAEGVLTRDGRGLYRHVDHDTSANIAFALAALRHPHSVICLLSALRYYEIGTQNPWEVWIAIDRKARKPRMDYPPLRVVRYNTDNLGPGLVTHLIDDVTVRMTTPERTIADCFKYRNKIGIDVCTEALREALKRRGFSIETLTEQARLCRVFNVIRPYIEAHL
jgi:predicted transcriptional regulator of viral defense system